jgi:hypothetical protein
MMNANSAMHYYNTLSFYRFLLPNNNIIFFAQGRWASLMQRRCLRFFEKMTFGFFQFRRSSEPNRRRRLTHELVKTVRLVRESPPSI